MRNIIIHQCCKTVSLGRMLANKSVIVVGSPLLYCRATRSLLQLHSTGARMGLSVYTTLYRGLEASVGTESMLYKLCLFCFSFINSYQRVKRMCPQQETYILVVELPNGTL